MSVPLSEVDKTRGILIGLDFVLSLPDKYVKGAEVEKNSDEGE